MYLRFLIIQEEPGSLASILRKKDLCDSIEFECQAFMGIGFCSIICRVTDRGVRHADEVINYVFQV